ncbi:50S ribosomal protein L25 [Chloroflexota bacterium]
MEGLTLQASKRNILGKKTRFLRRQGITPTHLFGHGVTSLSLQCDTPGLQRIIAQAGTTRLVALEIEGEKKPRIVFIREIRHDPYTRALLHADFYQIREKEKIKTEVPIVLFGEAPALKEKGRLLIHGITSLSVECLPDKLPPQIEVDLSPLQELGQAIHATDLALDPQITVTTAPDQMVVKVSEVYVERVEAVPEAEVETEAPPGEEPA